MSEQMTGITLPGGSFPGLAEYGRKTVAEMIALFRHRAEIMRQEADAILAAKDDDFYISTYRGILVQGDRVVLQEGLKP